MAFDGEEMEVQGGSLARVEAAARIPRDLSIIKMENDSIMAMAASRPRDYNEIKKEIVAQLKAFPTFAESARYAKPVGKMDKCPACGAETFYADNCPKCRKAVPQKIATGLSIRAAEALAEAYGYNRVETSTEDIPGEEDKVRITASFVDYQKGRIWRKSAVLSKTFKKRNGQTGRIPDDRFYGVTCQAKESILARECINRCVPPGLRSELEKAIDEIQSKGGMLTPEAADRIVAQFAPKGVTLQMIERMLAKLKAEWTQEDRKVLAGVWVALRDGEATVEELFPDGTESPAEDPAGDTTPPAASQAEALAAKLQGRKQPTASAAGAAKQAGTKPSPTPPPAKPAPAPEPPPVEQAPEEDPRAGWVDGLPGEPLSDPQPELEVEPEPEPAPPPPPPPPPPPAKKLPQGVTPAEEPAAKPQNDPRSGQQPDKNAPAFTTTLAAVASPQIKLPGVYSFEAKVKQFRSMVTGQGKNRIDLVLYKGATVLPAVCYGDVPEWLQRDADVFVTRCESMVFQNKPLHIIRGWEPPAPEPGSDG